MCSKRSLFVDMDDTVDGKVILDDFSKTPVKGRVKASFILRMVKISLFLMCIMCL